MEIDYITGLKTDEIYGMSKYQRGIFSNLENVTLNRIEYPDINKVINVFTRYCAYPCITKKEVNKTNVKYITSQDLGYLLEMLKLDKTVVTCHDLIPVVYDKTLLPNWILNVRGLKKADRITTISEFSKNDIIKYLKYPEDKISIVPPAVDHNIYYKKRDKIILSNLGISERDKVILYVGSEQPRKNLPTLIKAFGLLKKKLPDVKLLKVGKPQHPRARKKILQLIDLLGLQKDVIFIGYITESELVRYYNAADLFVFPSVYEGFGLPPLEAMACGTPVLTSNQSSLPEVVGESGIMTDPFDIAKMANNMYEILTNEGLKDDLSKRGIERSKMFSWRKSADKMLIVYEELNY